MEPSSLELDKKKFFANQECALILERDKGILLVIQLLVALLVVASFSNRIITENWLQHVRALVAVLLLLSPIMLWDYLLKINDGLNAIHRALFGVEKLQGERLMKGRLKAVFGGSVYVYAATVTVVFDFIAWMTLDSALAALHACLVQALLIAAIIFSKRLSN